jgi:hypothetical protein
VSTCTTAGLQVLFQGNTFPAGFTVTGSINNSVGEAGTCTITAMDGTTAVSGTTVTASAIYVGT